MGESGKRELRKEKRRKGRNTKKGKIRKRRKLRKAKKERGDKKKNRGRKKERGMRREQFPSGGEQKTQESPLYLDFPPLGIIIYMSKEYLIFKE